MCYSFFTIPISSIGFLFIQKHSFRFGGGKRGRRGEVCLKQHGREVGGGGQKGEIEDNEHVYHLLTTFTIY